MPAYDHQHLTRLQHVWIPRAVYYITICTQKRQQILTQHEIAYILRQEWAQALPRHGWKVGAYVIMPDHTHFLTVATDGSTTLSKFVQAWKQWSAKRISRHLNANHGIWQREFFDHVIRNEESYQEKVRYMFENPVRAGLVEQAEQWPYYGHIHFAQL